jgi:diguanylate cyclase (GGDEF)-like protein
MGISMFTLATGLSIAAWYSFHRAQNQIGIEGYDILSHQTEQFLKNQVQERARSLELQFAHAQSIASYGAGVLGMQLERRTVNQDMIEYILQNLFKSLGNPSAKVYSSSNKIGLAIYPALPHLKTEPFGISFQLSRYFPALKDFQKTEKSTLWSKPHPSAFDGGYDWVVDVISPVNKDKPYDSFIGISFSLTELITQFNQLHPTRGSYSFIMDDKQNLIAALPHARLELAPTGKFIERGLIQLANTENENLNTAFKEMGLGRSSLIKVLIKGEQKYLAFHPLEGMNWRLGIVVPVSTATSASAQLETIVEIGMKQALLRMLIGAFVIFGISLFLGSFLIRKLLIPLQQVSLASRSMVAGDFKQRVKVTSSDEISHLAQVFNQMADHIQVLISHLEHRAKELEQLNQSLEYKVSERTSKLRERTVQLGHANKQLHFEIKEREDAEKALRIANEALQRLATVDGLTQIPNRRYFDDKLQEEWGRLTREKQPLSLILFDVDFFKQYNDFYGHLAGDACLMQIAQLAKKSVKRPADFVARFGGEEFVLVLPNTERDGAIKIAKRIMQKLKKQGIPHERSDVSKYITISLGVSTIIPSVRSSRDKLIAMADQALYLSKEQGRNRYSFLP